MISLLDFNVPEWMSDAACTDYSPELWFPHEGANPNQAKAICRKCPVRAQCLSFALDIEGRTARASRFGLFGGKTPQERADLSKKRKKAS